MPEDAGAGGVGAGGERLLGASEHGLEGSRGGFFEVSRRNERGRARGESRRKAREHQKCRRTGPSLGRTTHEGMRRVSSDAPHPGVARAPL